MGKVLPFRKPPQGRRPLLPIHVEIGVKGEIIVQRLFFQKKALECRFSIEQVEEMIEVLTESIEDAKSRRSQRKGGQ